MNKIILFIIFSLCFLEQSFAQENWHEVSRPDVSAKLLKIYFFGSTYIINTDSDYYLISTNNGTNWEKINETDGFHSYDFVSPSIIYSLLNRQAPGAYSVLYKSTNTGTTFDSINAVSYGYAWANINFINSNTGFVNKIYNLFGPTIVERYSFLLKTTNSGVTWDTSSKFPYFVESMIGGGGVSETYFSSFANLNDTIGYATFVKRVGFMGNDTYSSYLKKTIDMGTTWTSITPEATIRFYGVFAVSPYYGYITSNKGLLRFKDSTYSMDTISTLQGYSYFKNRNEGFLYSKSNSFSLFNVKYTSDSGRTWSNLPINHFVSQIKFKDANTGFMITENGKIYRTTNGGAVNIFNGNTLLNDYALYQNYPNPFNPTTKISFEIPKSSQISLIVYDITGREVSRILNGEIKSAGRYEYEFNAENLSSGIYFYKLISDSFIETKKMVLIK